MYLPPAFISTAQTLAPSLPSWRQYFGFSFIEWKAMEPRRPLFLQSVSLMNALVGLTVVAFVMNSVVKACFNRSLKCHYMNVSEKPICVWIAESLWIPTHTPELLNSLMGFFYFTLVMWYTFHCFQVFNYSFHVCLHSVWLYTLI